MTTVGEVLKPTREELIDAQVCAKFARTDELVNDALAKVSELGTVGAMKWLATAIANKADSAPKWNAARDDHFRDATNMVPTEQMIDAGVAFALQVTISGDYNWSAYVRDLFINMAAAAPSNKEVER